MHEAFVLFAVADPLFLHLRKAKDLIKRLLAKKMYEEDDDFPGDEEEYYFYVHQGGKFRKDSKTTEKVGMKIMDKKLDEEFGEALIAETGPLAAGSMAAPSGMHEDGHKSLMEALGSQTKKPKAPKAGGNKAEPEQVIPKEPWELPGPYFWTWVLCCSCVGQYLLVMLFHI